MVLEARFTFVLAMLIKDFLLTVQAREEVKVMVLSLENLRDTTSRLEELLFLKVDRKRAVLKILFNFAKISILIPIGMIRGRSRS